MLGSCEPLGFACAAIVAAAVAAACGPRGTISERPARRDVLLQEGLSRHPATGMLAAVIVGDQVWAGAAGVADQAGTPARPDMRFRASSITKMVVAAAALRLVERGEFALDEPVAPVVGSGVLPSGDPTTLRHLLSHTSGLFDLGNDGDLGASVAAIVDPELRDEGLVELARSARDPAVVLRPEVCIAAAETNGRYGAPGEVFRYSNVGYEVVGLLLREVTGSTVDEVVQREIAEPLGLDHLSVAPDDLRAVPFHGTAGPDAVPEGPLLCGDPTGVGRYLGTGAAIGLVSTTVDLARFGVALARGRVIGEALLTTMRTPGDASPAAKPYGLGIARYQLSCGTFHGHRGDGFGTGSLLLVAEDGGRAVVVVANTAQAAGGVPLTWIADDLVCG